MPILVGLTLVPTLTFYFYVLVQFWREANRRRRHDTCMTMVELHSAGAKGREYIPRHPGEIQRHSIVAPTTQVSESVPDLDRAEQTATATVVATYLKNRLIALPSGTGRLAAKRAAKG